MTRATESRTGSFAVGVMAVVAVALLFLVWSPLAGWISLVRVAPVLVMSAFLVGVLGYRFRIALPEGWSPSSTAVWATTIAILVLVGWIALTQFQSGELNGVDFTVYFDRPCFQTSQGNPLLVESADRIGYSKRSQLTVHAHWLLLACGPLYSLASTPLWLIGLTAVSVALGARHIQRIVQSLTESGMLSLASALAFALNRNTGQVVNQGFHPEVLYLWFVPWFIEAGVRRQRLQALTAAVLTVLVKEDALMPIFAATLGLWLGTSKRWSRSDVVAYLVVPNVLTLANLGFYFFVVIPALSPSGAPTYISYWGSWGDTPLAAVISMMTHPIDLIRRAIGSAFFSATLVPHLFLPFIGWRWFIGVLPIALLYGAADDEQIRSFGLHYPAIVVPFLTISSAVGALWLARMPWMRSPVPARRASAAVLAGALLVGSTTGGYGLKPWKPELRAVEDFVETLQPGRPVLVQSGLYPHAGYTPHVQLLTPNNLKNLEAQRPIVVVSRSVGAYPFEAGELDALLSTMEVVQSTSGIVALNAHPGR